MSDTVEDLADGVAQVATQTIQAAAACGIMVEVTRTRISGAQQRYLNSCQDGTVTGRSLAQVCRSQCSGQVNRDGPHEYGLAFDSVTIDPCQFQAWVKIRRLFGWRVPKNDPAHSEVPQWRDIVAWSRVMHVQL